MCEEYAYLLAKLHNCVCLGPQYDKQDRLAFFLFNEKDGNKSTFAARTEAEFLSKVLRRRLIAL